VIAVPSGTPPAGTPSRAAVIVTLILLGAVPFLHLGRRVLWPPDEGRYALTVREMVASRDFVVPTDGGRPRIDKPPLFIWSGAVASLLFGGVSEASVRFPSALAAAMWLLATFALGARLFDVRTALLSAVVLATCGRFLLYSQWAATDTLLSSLTTFALAACVAGGGAPAGAGGRASLRLAALLFSAACGLAVLTKGPVGVVLPVAIVVADHAAAWWRAPRSAVERLRGVAIAWAAGAAVFLAVAAPWFILLWERLGAAGLREILFRQNVSRFLVAWNARQPWYFYFEVLPMDLLPWTFFLPLAFLWIPRLDAGRAASWRFLRTWLVVVFVFFSSASGESPEYLMPLLPAAALAAGRLFVLAAGTVPAPGIRLLRDGLSVAAGLLTALGAVGSGVLLFRGGDLLPGAGGLLCAAAAIVTLGAAACLVLIRAGRARAAAATLGAAVLVVRVALGGPLMDAGNAVNLAPAVGRDLLSLLPPGSEVGVGRKGSDYIRYYAPVPLTVLDRPARVEAFLAEGPPRAVILKGREYREIAPRLAAFAEVAARWGDDERGFVLLKAFPRAAAPEDATSEATRGQ